MDMKKYADMHIHLLHGVDDGADDETEMYEILDAAYKDGCRVICTTPHFHLGYFGDNRARALKAYEQLKQYAGKYEDLKLHFGNELRFCPNCTELLKSGACSSLNDTKYVLVDFREDDDGEYIVSSLLRLLNAGYKPVLAHAERYAGFHRDFSEIKYLRQCGITIQVDAQSPFGAWGRAAKKRSRKLIELFLTDIVASDAHNTASRPPQMGNCYDYVAEKCGEDYARLLFWNNPIRIIEDNDIERAN